MMPMAAALQKNPPPPTTVAFTAPCPCGHPDAHWIATYASPGGGSDHEIACSVCDDWTVFAQVKRHRIGKVIDFAAITAPAAVSILGRIARRIRRAA